MKTPTDTMAEDFFDYSIRIHKIIWLAAQGDGLCEDLKELLEDEPELLERLLCIPIQPDMDAEDFLSTIARNRKNGFLIEAETPIPTAFYEHGFSFSWGYYTSEWFYFEELNPTVVGESLIKWREDFVEKRRLDKAREGAL